MSNRSKIDNMELSYDHFPYFYNSDFMKSPDTLWLKVTPKTFRPNVTIQTGYNKGSLFTTSLRFLLGKSISMGLNHTWEELDTLSGAIRNVTSTAKQQASDASSVFKSLTGDNVSIGQRFDIYSGGKSAKNDNPIIYKNTDRRSFQVEFNFVAHRDAKKEVWNPIQSLMIWSCAESYERGQFDTTFKFPYIFRVQTITGDDKETGLVSFDDAAITSVLPVYNEPYKDGYPMSATCQVTFMDINPVYRNRISSDGKSKINVGYLTTDGGS